jgi:hypothetical protein
VSNAGRRKRRIVALVGWAGIILGGSGGCQTDSQAPSCDFQEQVAEVGTPLTLLPHARLDQVGSGFVLMGFDGRLVRWATVDTYGQLGTEQSVPLPASTAGPWFAAAGQSAPGDRILIAYGTAAATAGMVDIQLLAVPASGSGSPVAAGTLVTVPDPAALDGAMLVMGSGRLGMRAGLAWSIPGRGEVRVQSLGGDGQPQGTPLAEALSGAQQQVECLSFVAGKDDLALGYLAQESPADPSPGWTILEVHDQGTLDSSAMIRLGTSDTTCPHSAASGAGYVTVWQNELGSLIAVYDGTSNTFTTQIFAGAVTFGGADVQPPLAGVGPVSGGDFAVVLARPGAAEAWRVSPAGKVAAQTVVFPSSVGQMGDISTVSLSGALYSSYADYSSADSVGKDGQRFFVKVTCF